MERLRDFYLTQKEWPKQIQTQEICRPERWLYTQAPTGILHASLPRAVFGLMSVYFRALKRTLSSMASSERKLIAVCQMTANNNKDQNYETCKKLIESAKEKHAQMVFLPEACDYIAQNKEEALSLAESLDGPLMQNYCNLAKENEIWLSLGGVHEKVSDTKVHNAHVVIDDCGKIIAVYNKTHLFDIEIPEKGIRLKESDYVAGGSGIVEPVPTPVGKVGLAICYDMRFPELSLVMTKLGAEILTFPSAFTFETGSAHWETILRTRAIENQCYIVAAAQTGKHNQKRTSWGHAIVVDPWGTLIAQCSEGTGLALAEIDRDLIYKIRSSMPVWQHRRLDLYPELISLKAEKNLFSEDVQEYQFGQTSVPSTTVFYKTKFTIAFTNKKCVLPGHVLVAPIRTAQRLLDLTAEEISDLFMVVQKVQDVAEREYNVNSSTITVQDGIDAGQTIKHVHVHILPRRAGDFEENDQIYHELQKHDKKPGGWRTTEEMTSEAQVLRKYFEP